MLDTSTTTLMPAAEPAAPARKLLHVGCGPVRRERLPVFFQSSQWQEIRFDIDERVAPDIIGSMTDMSAVQSASMDAIWSSHNLEHLDSFQVPVALAEFKRVLRQDGFALITLPDLRAIARCIMRDQIEQPLYHSPAGPISPLDILFGHQAAIAVGNGYMAHRTGFSARTLGEALVDAGFAEVRVHEGRRWDLWAVATMPDTDPALFEALAGVMK